MKKDIAAISKAQPGPKKLIGIFGTSANPPTGIGGHYSLVEWAVNNPCLYDHTKQPMSLDQLWVLPVYRHINDKNSSLISFEHRFSMANLNFSDITGVEVKALEKEVFYHLKNTDDHLDIGTIDLIKYLLQKNPHYHFVLILGEDTYRDLHNGLWKNSQQLLDLIEVVGIKRKPSSPQKKQELFDIATVKDISSTLVRKHQNKEDMKKFLRREVYDYIQKYKLYQK